jgi:RNA 2',3'-cyclic 3'-phosphodiesterase
MKSSLPTSALRLFIAVETPPDVQAVIKETVDQLRSSNADVRWESADKWHCTIKFLGDTPRDRVAALSESLHRIAADTSPFSLVYRSLGCFPGKRDPRIIWAGIDSSDGAMGDLSGRVDEAMGLLGFEKENRPFHPHVTLGRVRGNRQIPELLTIMETVTFESQPVVINQIVLIRSDLRPTGSVYTVQESYSLHHSAH